MATAFLSKASSRGFSSNVSGPAMLGRQLAQFAITRQTTPFEELRVKEPASLEEAYEAQNAGILEQGRASHPIHGWKIGATNDEAMKRMGLREPFFGPLYKKNLLRAASSHGEHVLGSDNWSGITLRGIEVEWAAVMKKNLQPHGAAFTLDQVLKAVDYWVPALEVCASRLKKPHPSAFVSIADQASHGLLLLGGEKISVPTNDISSPQQAQEWAHENLNNWSVSLFDSASIDSSSGQGKELAKGSGKDVLTTGPLTALAWLANTLGPRTIEPPVGPLASESAGQTAGHVHLHLKAGDVVTTGTMTGLTPIVFDGKNKKPHAFGMAEASYEAAFVDRNKGNSMKLSVAFLR